MMNKITLTLLATLWLLSCSAPQAPVTTANAAPYPDSIHQEINRRLDLMDQKFFKNDSTLILKPQQREALYPILGEKVTALSTAKQNAPDKKALQAKRKEIREAWHPKINSALDTTQLLLRQAILALQKPTTQNGAD